MELVAVVSLLLVFFAANTDAQCRYGLIAQKGLRINTTGDIYVDFHDCQKTVTIVATLWSLPDRRNEHDRQKIVNIKHADGPIKISLQAKSDRIENTEFGNPVLRAELDVRYCFGRNCGAPWTNIPAITILLNVTHGYVLMTTDRPAYRPGDKVKIALALANQDLKPENHPRSLKIFVKTPDDKGRIIVHDKDISISPTGFKEHEYRIPDSPMEGTWWTEVHADGIKMAEKSFVIDTYELPTFHVKILPKYHFMMDTMTHIEGVVVADYSYGEKVNGVYYMTFSLVRPDGTEREFFKIPTRFGLEEYITQGSVEYEVPVEHLLNILREGETIPGFADSDARIVITASVTGLAESVFESDVVDDIVFTKSPFIVDYSQSAKFFLPGTIHEIRVTIRDAYSRLPMPNINVTISYTGLSKVFLSDEHGEVSHLVDSFSADTEIVTITASTADFPSDGGFQAEFDVRKYVPTRTLGVRLKKQVADVGDQQYLIFDLGHSRPTNIRFYVVARGQFVYADKKKIKLRQIRRGGSREVTAAFQVTASMVPSARVLAYYILDGGLTSNSAWFDVTNQCEKELSITLAESAKPGDQIQIGLNGAPNAYVLAMAVDRAAYFVHNQTRVNRQQLWSKMTAYDTGCSRKGGLDATNVFEEAGLSFSSSLTQIRNYRDMSCEDAREKRSAQPTPDQVRSNKIQNCARDGQNPDYRSMNCSQRRIITRGNLVDGLNEDEYIDGCLQQFYTACTSHKMTSPLGRALAKAEDKANQVRARKRENFAESMFFFIRRLNSNGKDEMLKTVTDSITYYDVDAFGMSDQSPMCVAETKSIKIFSKFFIQLYLPYSLKVREQAQIRYAIFNYGNVRAQVDVFIRHTEDLCSRQQAVDEFDYLTSLSVGGHSAQSSTFTILPLRVSSKASKIELKAGSSGNDAVADYIEREILVEDEGQHNESSKTIVLEPGEHGATKEKTMIFDIPERSTMPTTEKCFLYAYAHPMGPNIELDPFTETLHNMDRYIHQPHGCGEQNMIIIGPNVYIHRYRLEVYGDSVTAEQKKKVVEHIQTAYGIELKWRSDLVNDTAFARFNHYPPGTWLNAFVTKVFTAAKEFWPRMDIKPICSALEWLLKMQNNDTGHFRENRPLDLGQRLGGFVNDEISLTAFVIISLVEAASPCPDLTSQLQESANRANAYLKAHRVDAVGTPYILAMGAYALALSEPGSAEAHRWNELLWNTVQHDEDYMFWKGKRGRAANIETTAYGLLAEITLNGINSENQELTWSVAHWLISQRNAEGGFLSTQDTVVALQALTTYMKILESATQAPPSTNLTVEIRSHEEHKELAILKLTSQNAMRKTDVDIEGGKLASLGGVTVSVSGEGVGSFAYRCIWRQYSGDGLCNFNVSIWIENDGTSNQNQKILKVFVSKPVPPAAEMSIIDVGILSGYKPDKDSIEQLCNAVDRSADRYEITNNTIKFYVKDIDSKGRRLGFKITEEALVQNRQPASVSAYDYYEPDIRCTKFYTEDGDFRLRTNCQGGNTDMCKCAEGSCPICRTRDKQLTDTVCSNHQSGNSNQCELADLCPRPKRKEDCYNLHRKTCDSHYLYIVNVTEVGDDESGFKYFLARIEEVIRESVIHQRARGSVAKFTMRKDCFDLCKDDRLERLAHQPEYIKPDRWLMIYGSQPGLEKSKKRYVYDLTEAGGLEITLSKEKCIKLLKKSNQDKKRNRAINRKLQEKLSICSIKSVLSDAHHNGCD